MCKLFMSRYTFIPSVVRRLTFRKSGNLERQFKNEYEEIWLEPPTGYWAEIVDETSNYSVRYWYDPLGRLSISQNSKQYNTGSSARKYSYTTYDALGRISEVGEATTTLDPADLLNGNDVIPNLIYTNWLAGSSRSEVIKTYYDYETISSAAAFTQENLRNRVSSTTTDKNGDGTFEHATYYSYDIQGNVTTLIQDNEDLALYGQQYKRIDYDIDPVSNKVLGVKYQDGSADQYYLRYDYDKDNRLSEVFTSKDGLVWDNDARYLYYEHGPLARTEIGEQKVQATDYAYTLQGWIKGVNSDNLSEENDMGKDANSDNSYLSGEYGIHEHVAKDAYGYSIGYFNRDKIGTSAFDYIQIGSANSFFASISSNNNLSNASGLTVYDAPSMYNGNIKHIVTTLTDKDPGNLITDGTAMPLLTAYRYDQLYRLRNMKTYKNLNLLTNEFGSEAAYDGSYETSLTYDQNGNILTHNRKGNGGNAMDQLTYQYDWNNNDPAERLKRNNRLFHVNDAVGGCTGNDITDQGTFTSGATIATMNNYSYDEIGNLKKDEKEYISEIKYNLQGKISEIIKDKGYKFNDLDCDGTQDSGEDEIVREDLEFRYDSYGRRIAKIVKPHLPGGTGISNEEFWTATYYILDASGNQLATYSKAYESLGTREPQFNGIIKLDDNIFYGSSRLGIEKRDKLMASALLVPSSYKTDGSFILVSTTMNSVPHVNPYLLNRTLGNKQYEVSNHLGNVLTVVTDRKIPVNSIGTPTIISFYTADISSYTDYYPFGMEMPGRSYTSQQYKYGLNGMMKTDEVNGVSGSHYTAQYWEYDSRLGRRWNIDPVPNFSLSSYATFNNNPIYYIDPNGDKPIGDIVKSIGRGIKNIWYGNKHHHFVTGGLGGIFKGIGKAVANAASATARFASDVATHLPQKPQIASDYFTIPITWKIPAGHPNGSFKTDINTPSNRNQNFNNTIDNFRNHSNSLLSDRLQELRNQFAKNGNQFSDMDISLSKVNILGFDQGEGNRTTYSYSDFSNAFQMSFAAPTDNSPDNFKSQLRSFQIPPNDGYSLGDNINMKIQKISSDGINLDACQYFEVHGLVKVSFTRAQRKK